MTEHCYQDFLTHDDLLLCYERSEGSKPVRVVVVHGFGETIERYHELRDVLLNTGYEVCLYEQRGFGHSEGSKAYVNSLQDYLDDLSSFLDMLNVRYGRQEKTILLAHSLGGLIATHWCLQNKGQVEGVVLSSPCFRIKVDVFRKALIYFFNSVSPKLMLPKPVKAKNLTHDDEKKLIYETDPFVMRKISARLLHEMLVWGKQLEAEPVKLDCSVTFLLSGLDPVVDTRASQRIFKSLQAPSKREYLFEAFLHEIFNESHREVAFDTLRKSLVEMIS